MATKKLLQNIELIQGEASLIAPDGFKVNGISCGIKTNGKKDLCIIFSEEGCVASAVFTTNKVKAAPLKISKNNLKNKIHAIICNSGNANACTGRQGVKDVKEIIKNLSSELEIPENSILVCSTGVIGVNMPMDSVNYGISKLKRKLIAEHNVRNAADAILTTDTKRKTAVVKCIISGKVITISGIAKGSGMINPNMATMLAFLTTDANINQKMMNKALKNVVKQTFNKISVDGQMSTNDTVILLSNKRQKNVLISRPGNNYNIFEMALKKLCEKLSTDIVNDGEGATKIIKIKVKGALNKNDAEKIAREIANSVLVKTAFYGQSANWGRIMQAIGASDINIIPDKINIYFNEVQVCENGLTCGLKMVEGKQLLNKRNINVVIDLGMGRASDYIITTDLSYDYVKINSHYS